MGFPPPPTEAVDWSNVGFKCRDCNGHIESHYSSKTGWSPPKFVQSPTLSFHGMSASLNYGQQAFEGLKAYRLPGDQLIGIFRPDKNAKRMAHSAEVVSIPPVSPEHFERCVQLAVGLNADFVPPHDSGASMYIRPLLTASGPQLGLNPNCDDYLFTVYVMPVGPLYGLEPADALILDDFDRSAPRGTGHAKLGGNYAPVFRWTEHAKKEGYGITLHLDAQTRTKVDEFSTSGFIGITKTGEGENDFVLTVAASEQAIQSVVCDSAFETAKSLGWKAEKREVMYDELKNFTEVVAAGTAAMLMPVRSITMKSRGDKFEYAGQDGKPGPGFQKLSSTLRGIQTGAIKDSFGWLRIVKEPKDFESDGSNPLAHTNGTKKILGSVAQGD